MSIFFAGDTALGTRDPSSKLCLFDLTSLVGSSPLIINLEGPVLESEPVELRSYDVYKFNLFSLSSVFDKFSSCFNIVAVTLANNHTCDYKNGLKETLNYLDFKKIKYCGVKDSKYISLVVEGKQYIIYSLVLKLTDINKISLAELNAFSQRETLNELKVLRKSNEDACIIVQPHWGYELQDIPLQADKKLCEELISSGVDYVIGHHPHVIQDSHSNNRVYSIGNFILDQGPYLGKKLHYSSDDTKKFYIVELTDDFKIIKHLFRLDNDKVKYLGDKLFYPSRLKSEAPKGYPKFKNWNSNIDNLLLSLIDMKKVLRKFLIKTRIHKPYNW